MQTEIYVDHHLHCYGMTLEHCRVKFVLPHSFNGPFIQAHTQVANYVNVLRVALRVDDELNRDYSLVVGLASFRSELRFRRKDDAGCADAAADIHDTTAVATIAARPRSSAVALANASSHAETKSGVASRSLRGEGDLWRLRRAEFGHAHVLRHSHLHGRLNRQFRGFDFCRLEPDDGDFRDFWQMSPGGSYQLMRAAAATAALYFGNLHDRGRRRIVEREWNIHNRHVGCLHNPVCRDGCPPHYRQGDKKMDQKCKNAGTAIVSGSVLIEALKH